MHWQSSLLLYHWSLQACINKTLSFCLPEAGRHTLPTKFFSCLARARGMCNLHRGLGHLTLMTKRTGIPELHGTVTTRKKLLAGHCPQGSMQTADWNTAPVFLWKRPIYLACSFSLKDMLLGFFYTFRGLGAKPGRHHACTLPWLYCSSVWLPRKEFIYSFGAPIAIIT